MSSYVSAELRRQLEEHAGGACEYCRIYKQDTFLGCQVDHIIAEKHGGLTTAENLAYACAPYNRAKGSDIASIVHGTERLVRLYNPRLDRWEDHFRIDTESLLIQPLTDIGTVPSRLLGLNELPRVLERQSLVQIGHYSIPKSRPK